MESPKQDFSQTLYKVDDDEKLLAVIKRHPFGILKLYFQVIVGLGAAGGLIFYLLPDLVNAEDHPEAYSLIGLVAVILVAFVLLIVGVATVIYYQSQLIVTDKTITQTIQTSLFSKKISQLSVTNIEDVTSDRRGIFASIFNFGKLFVETAGEQENFHFEYCPHSDHYAKLILDTRQSFLGHRESERQAVNQPYSDLHPAPAAPAAYYPAQPVPTAEAAPQMPPPPMPIPPTPTPAPPVDPTSPSNPYSGLPGQQ